MTTYTVMSQNWLTQKTRNTAAFETGVLTILLFVLFLLNQNNDFDLGTLLPASRDLVFAKHEYWRLWSTLFVHGDIGHLLSNSFLFVPLAYFLTGYFGPWFFPVFGLFVGGIINALVLMTLPAQVHLVGISGVVYWMGSAWLTLYFLIDKRDSLRRRLGKVLVLSLIVFFPQTFQPQVSYLSHLLGFIFGVPSALLYYAMAYKKIVRAEVYQEIIEEDLEEPVFDLAILEAEVPRAEIILRDQVCASS